ncbi:MAG: histidinol dehydrogenase [Tabrizicola sp.]|nr:histidinol dehydrogenase [Tabrizicola sp.]
MTSSDDFHPQIRDHGLLSPAERAALLLRPESDLTAQMEGAGRIIAAVRERGYAALIDFAREFDRADSGAKGVEVQPAEFDAAFAALDSALIETLELSADHIRRFHQAQLPQEMWLKEIRPGVLVGERTTPVDSAALYAPRGKGSFPSVTLMTTIPAVVAGVPEPILLTPAGPDGRVDAATLVAARIAGIRRVFRAGGAAAVAAAAFGTQSIPRCVVFEGPGSPWVVAAKRLLSGQIASRVPAGPSEAILLADETADIDRIALDLLIEAEHGADSSVHLVTWVPGLAQAVAARLPQLLAKMTPQRRAFAQAVLDGDHGGMLVTADAAEAYAFINDYAPEHLQILSKQPFDHLTHIRNASEILLGEHTPGSAANYLLGPNAVLPTAGGGKWSSPLGVHTFIKSASVAHMTDRGLAALAPHIHRFASYEGFDAHAMAVSELRPG